MSCSSAAGILRAIDRDAFDVVPIGIAKDGRWVLVADDPQALDLAPGHVPHVDGHGDGVLGQLFDSPMPDVVADPARVAEWAQTVADGTTARWPVTGRRRDDDDEEDGCVDALRSYWPRENLPA